MKREDKAREESKREKAFDPVERWKAIQETITWAEAQQNPPRNSKEKCLDLEKQKLARWK